MLKTIEIIHIALIKQKFSLVYFKKSVFIIILIVFVIYISIILYSDIEKISDVFLKINYLYLPLILFSHTLSLITKSFRQRVLLSEIGIHLTLKDNFLLYLSGMSLLATPGGLGTAIRSQFIKQNHGHSISKTLPIVLVEKFHDAFSVVLIVWIFSIFYQIREVQYIMIVLSLVLGCVYFSIKSQRVFNSMTAFVLKFGFMKKFTTNIIESQDTVRTLAKKKIFVISWLITLLSWSIDAIAINMAFRAFNLDFNIIQSTVITFTSIIVGAISFIPGGIGVTEASLIGLLVLVKVDLVTASSLTLFIRFSTIWFTTCLGIIPMKILLLRNKKND